MDAQTISQTNYLDIIYQNRNKAYGSYELRSHYERRAIKSLMIVFSGIGLLSLYAALTGKAPVLLTQDVRYVEHQLTDVHIDQPKIKIELPKVVPPPAAKPTIANPIPKIVEDTKVTETPKTVAELSNAESGLKTTTGNINGTASTAIPGNSTTAVVSEAEKPLTWSEIPPEFNGNLLDYLSRSLQYPAGARDMGIEGKVIVQFVVNEDGSVSNAHVVKGIGGGCDEEALRVVNGMQRWKPGKQNGHAVKVFYTLPIRFVLQ